MFICGLFISFICSFQGFTSEFFNEVNWIMSTNKVRKKDISAELIRKNQDVFKCPVCSRNMYLNNSFSLVCSLNHCYDISKKGYLNLLNSQHRTIYSKELFEARHKVCNQGFYEPLIEQLSILIQSYIDLIAVEKEMAIVDVGCGEGSHLYNLYEKIRGNFKFNLIGADISKEGISIAATASNDIIWIVADLTRLPFKNKSVDVILNILSPANYPEFERILSDDGIIIKVIPGEFYLKELREAVYENKSYSNQKVTDYFSKRLKVILSQKVSYQFNVDEELLPELIKMTPLIWGRDIKSEVSLQQIDIKAVTVDLTVLVGKIR